MSKINNLSDLREEVEENVIQKIFTEYFMELNAKANMFDKIVEKIEKGEKLESIIEVINK